MNLHNAIQKHLNTKIVSSSTPLQGMGSFVFFVETASGFEYAVKVSDENNNDATVLTLIQESRIDISVPKLIDSFAFQDKSIVIMERIKTTLLENIQIDQMHKYIPSMVENLNKLHRIKSKKAGYINSKNKSGSFKEILLSTFNQDLRTRVKIK